jgi:hypothetical protein
MGEPQDWQLRYAENMRDFEGYSIGKLLSLIKDLAIISLAGGLLSPEIFFQLAQGIFWNPCFFLTTKFNPAPPLRPPLFLS